MRNKRVWSLLLALTLASLLIGCGVSKPVYFLFTACFAGGYALVGSVD